MKTTEFKVHSVYSKDDIVKMQKIASRKMRLSGLALTGIAFILYLALFLWDFSKGETSENLFQFIVGRPMDIILLAALAFSFVMSILLPYFQANKILKAVPGGVLKANYYFYEKTFQYGWGNKFSSIGFVEIQELFNLEKAFYIKANDVSYWIKKEDFEVGTPEDFLTYMQGKVKCKIK